MGGLKEAVLRVFDWRTARRKYVAETIRVIAFGEFGFFGYHGLIDHPRDWTWVIWATVAFLVLILFGIIVLEDS